jgi:hypothetical protein
MLKAKAIDAGKAGKLLAVVDPSISLWVRNNIVLPNGCDTFCKSPNAALTGESKLCASRVKHCWPIGTKARMSHFYETTTGAFRAVNSEVKLLIADHAGKHRS